MNKLKNFLIWSFLIFASCAGLETESRNTSSILSEPENIKTVLMKSESSTSILIKWTDTSNNEKGFTLQRSNDLSFSEYQEFELTADSTVFIDNLTGSDTLYFYRIRSFTEKNKSPWSRVSSLQLSRKKPDTPSNFTGAPCNSTCIYISWMDNESEKTSYELQYSMNQDFSNSHSVFLDIDINQTVLEELEPGENFYLRLRSCNGKSTSDWTENLCIELQKSEDSV